MIQTAERSKDLATNLAGGASPIPPVDASSIAPAGFFSSPLGISIAWFATVLSLVLAAVSIALYIREQGKSKTINELLQQFGIRQKLDSEVGELKDGKERLANEVGIANAQISSLREDIEKRIPMQARAAFYNAAIPDLEIQISALLQQREMMARALSEIPEAPALNDAITKIISEEIELRISARRKLDESQIRLSIFTGIAAALSGLWFLEIIAYPFTIAIGLIIAWVSYDLGKHWAIVYPSSKLAKFILSRHYKTIPIFFVAMFIAIGIVGMSYLIWMTRGHIPPWR